MKDTIWSYLKKKYGNENNTKLKKMIFRRFRYSRFHCSLSTRITLVFFTIVACITLAYFVIYFTNFIAINTKDTEIEVCNSIDNLYASITDEFNTWAERIKIAAIGISSSMNRKPFRESDRQDVQNILARIVNSQAIFQKMYCFSNNPWYEEGGFFISSTSDFVPEADFNNTKRSWFIAAKNARGKVAFGDPMHDAETGVLVTTVSIDLFNETGESNGVISGSIPISSLTALVERRQWIDKQHTYIINRDGYFITNKDQHKVLAADFFEEYALEKYRHQILYSQSFFITDNEYLIYSLFIPIADWFLVTVLPVSTFSNKIFVSLMHMVSLELLIMLVAGVLVWYLTRKLIVKPIQEIEDIANALAKQDFSVEIRLNRLDEIGSMQKAFIKIRNNLRGAIQSLNDDLLLAKEKAEKERDNAKNANKAKSSFLASMSHEIRTPMNAIIGMSDLIRTDNFDKTQKHYFADIRKMAQALLQIINDILDFSKIEAGKMDIVPVHYNILDLYNNICSLTQFTTGGSSVMFLHSFSESIPLVLYGDEVRVRQIITNIVNNAVKYTREGSVSLDFGYKKENEKEFLVITVKDTGVGIKKEDLSKIFIAFEQADIKKNHGIMGTGLGLAITNKFIELMNGGISVDSEYGKGSIFKVTLPLICGNAEKIRKEKAANFIVTPDVSMLIVDDVALNLTVALGFLSKRQIAADTAISGYEAIEKIKKKSYDIVFMDHMMPEMDGVETTLAIREMYDPAVDSTKRFRDVPVIALTANAIAGVKDFFLQSGMNDFISKPIEPAKLDDIILSFLPEDKIQYINIHTEANEVLEKKNKTILDEISLIEGLDAQKGLAYLKNNIKIYFEMLREFCAGYKEYVETILKQHAAADWRGFAIKIHAVKGICAGLTVENLRVWAFNLEKAAKDGNVTMCIEETPAFCAALTRLGEKLSATSLIDGETNGERKPIERAELLTKLRTLIAYCDSTLRGEPGAANKAENLSYELTQNSYTDESESLISEIAGFIKDFDYDEAITYTEQLLKKL